MRKVLEHCPSCGGKLEITRLNCTECETIILGRYAPCPFCSLTPESVSFLESFIRCRGNVKEMERELGISYWTIRRKIDELIADLGLEAAPTPPEDAPQALDILERVNRGELSAAEATRLLTELREAS